MKELKHLVLLGALCFAAFCEVSDIQKINKDASAIHRYRRVLWRTGLFVAAFASFLGYTLNLLPENFWKFGATVWLAWTWSMGMHNFYVEDSKSTIE